ncbi:mechanosensitive ion channel family protein [Thiohalomonas denitrificans]|uniref:Small-conductance mechanosensitive channel n=1 Tax=Thiohalomonas denitrificans TaxID=415747 RepID=A0A1G5Q9X4_9GAMM|nr:mechanosensitive ion channel domain-containing protein [Thiohalomonas denitrificans]SCZ58472.1 Small-conductance mechanosensitive channel [Thiohalomonas denitrificans]
MESIIRLVGPNQAVEFLGVRLVGINAENGIKLIVSVILVFLVLLLGKFLRGLAHRAFRDRHKERLEFWAIQTIGLSSAILLLVVLVSIWFDDPSRLATALGLITAGLAFALQRVVTAIAGYFIILRGKVFNVGDRIVMGGVRGDVISLRITQTTIMEMGQPPAVQAAAPAVWIHSRQYTGRVVTVSNARILDEPVYNYTRDFPYIWEEMSLPIRYESDRERAETILLEAARRHTIAIGSLSKEALDEMRRWYFFKPTEVWPLVYYRLTDNWLELTVRFIVEDHNIREVKDAITRDVLRELEHSGIPIASQTMDIVGLPPLHLHSKGPLGSQDYP